MNSELLKQHALFKKQALYNPVVEKKRSKPGDDESGPGDEPKKKKAKKEPSSPSTSGTNSEARRGGALSKDPFAYKTLGASSSHNFGLLARIVNNMKQRFLEGDTEALTLQQILDENNMLDISSRQKHWLETEALVNNPKIEVKIDGAITKYQFKPKFNIKDKKTLLRLLDRTDQKGEGGIWLDEIQESLPNAEKFLKQLEQGGMIIILTRPTDKKKVVYYNDRSIQFKVDEEFQKLWRSVSVEGIEEGKIEDYLEKQGITSMQDQGMRKAMPIQKRKKPTQKKPRSFKKHNEHMADILQDYSDK